MTNFPKRTVQSLLEDGSIVDLKDGNHGELHPTSNDYVADGIPFIMASDLNGNGLDLKNCKFISHEQASQLRKGFSITDDVLLTHKGTLGNVAIVPEVSPYIMLTPQVTYYRTNAEKLINRYLAYAFRDPLFQSQMKAVAREGTRPYIGITAQQDLVVPVPSLSIQKRIIELLQPYDDLIDNNNRRIALLEEAIHRLYREWFVHLRFPGHEHTPVVAGVPEGWEKRPLSELATTQYGYTESAQDEPVGPKYLRGTDINKTSYIDWSTVPYCPIDDDILPKFKLDKYDILMIRMADPGKVGIVEKEIESVFASYLVRIKPISEELTPYYLFYFLNSHEYQGFITGASTGATRKSASAKLMTSVKIMLPSQTIQQAFADYVVPMRQQITTLLTQNEKLREARDALLPRLMNGSLPV